PLEPAAKDDVARLAAGEQGRNIDAMPEEKHFLHVWAAVAQSGNVLWTVGEIPPDLVERVPGFVTGSRSAAQLHAELLGEDSPERILKQVIAELTDVLNLNHGFRPQEYCGR